VSAYLGDISLSILGYSAYLIPISLIWLGYRIHKNTGQKSTHLTILIIRLVAFISLIAFSAALFAQSIADPAGGWIGDMMHGYFGVLFGSASFIVYLSIMMISFSITSTASWANIFTSTGGVLGTLLAKFKEVRAQAKAKKVAKVVITPKKVSTPKSSVMAKVKSAKIKPNKKIKKVAPASSNLFNTKALSGLPDLSLLDEISINTAGYSEQALEDMSRQVELKLKDFGFEVTTTTVTPGPVVTQFELSLAPGVKVSQIMNLNKDLARALLVESVRIVDVIPGKPVIGLEIPNTEREMISLKEILASEEFAKSPSMLTMGLGKDINWQKCRIY